MEKLRLLIVDDADDNRLVLRAICRKLEGFEIRDAVDGLEAVDIAGLWRPHIILMDIMMPNMDGFEASKIILERYPEIVIMAVSAVNDSRVEDNMSAIGVDIYIHKPIDRKLIRYKLQSIGSSIRAKLGISKTLSKKIALNPFNSDIRSFKTIFDIMDIEAMMDFGIWLYDQYHGKLAAVPSKYDNVLEIFYKLMSQGNSHGESMSIIIEESHEEFYITMKFERAIHLDQKLLEMIKEFETEFIVKENILCTRLKKPQEMKASLIENIKPVINTNIVFENKQYEQEEKEVSTQEIRVFDSKEKELMRQTFTHKTNAVDYVNDIGGDILDEILDLSSVDQEWEASLVHIEKYPIEENFVRFADDVLSSYIRVINTLFEFTALAYALSALSAFIKNSAKAVCQDSEKTEMFIMLLEHLGGDLKSWREHVFVLQNTSDIHYLDSSFFSSCMQIEGIIDDKHLDVNDDNDMEFF